MASERLRVNFDESAIDAIFAALDQCALPGAAAAIAIDGRPVYRKGFGLANMELPVLLSPSMKMRIGSTTKHFTALAYMLLCEDGRAGVDDPIGRHLPEVHPAIGHVTMRQLMGHTSGVPQVQAITPFIHGLGRPLSDREMLRHLGLLGELDFEPGTCFSYNNGGYTLLTLAIERIAGEPLEEVLRKRILEPAGMCDTRLRRNDIGFEPNSATLHNTDSSGRFTHDYMGTELTGSGGMVSTMDDMLRWLKHMDAPVVGTAETWRLMREPHRLANGVCTGYGFGLQTVPYRGIETLQHGGGVMGGNSQMIKLPAAGLDISVAVNRADVSAAALADRIIDACVEDLEPPAAPSPAGTRTGIYANPAKGKLVVLSEQDGAQFMSWNGGPAMPATLGKDGVVRFNLGMLNIWLATDAGTARLSEFGNETVLDLVEPEPGARVGAMAGRYAWDALEASAELIGDEAGARLITRDPVGEVEWRLEHVHGPFWKAVMHKPEAAWGIAVATIDPDAGEVRMSQGLSNIMHFKRVG